jgi:hypothetical protein
MKVNKETSELIDTLHQLDSTDICKVFHLDTAQYTVFSADHGTFSKTDDVLGQRACLNKYDS